MSQQIAGSNDSNRLVSNLKERLREEVCLEDETE